MLILISCAKTMASGVSAQVPLTTTPIFEEDSREIISAMSQLSVEELSKTLKINVQIAEENFLRYKNFDNRELSAPALFLYTGAVFKNIDPKSLTQDELLFAQEHLRITSFAYGLLRPLDLINPYRMEGTVKLHGLSQNMFDYWKPKLTDLFIDDIKAHGGVLCNLASSEMRKLFDWKRVEREVRVISPEFKTYKDGKFKTIVMYAKIARGETTRSIIKNKPSDQELIETFK